MCKRFVLEPEDCESLVIYPGYDPSILFAPIVQPGSKSYILVEKEGQLHLASSTFGLAIKDKIIYNARSETVEEKPLFQKLFQENRCVIPATGFYEEDKNKKEYFFLPKEKEMLYFAGLYDKESFVILTCKPSDEVSFYHPRMPLCFKEEDILNYLNVQNGSFIFDVTKRPELIIPEQGEQLSLF